MREPEMDPRSIAWLREGPASAPEWVLDGVLDHARHHPRGPSRTPWSTAMHALTLRRPHAPALRLALVAGLAVVVVAAGGVFLAGSQRGLVGPVVSPPAPPPSAEPSRSASPEPTPLSLTPGATVAATFGVWRRGDLAAAAELYAPGHRLHVVGDLSQQGGSAPLDPDHFALTSEGHGYDYWEPRGIVFGEGAFRAIGMVAGYWDPGSHGFNVYRFDETGRIAVTWVVIGGPNTASHEGTPIETASAGVEAFVDGCLAALAAGDGAGYAACFTPELEARISAGDGAGAWTESLVGVRDTLTAVAPASAYAGAVRAGAVEMIGDVLAYPFRSDGSDECREGIDVLRLNAERTAIRTHWAFCGPVAGEASSPPSETADALGMEPAEVIAAKLRAWREGQPAAAGRLLAPGYVRHLIGDTPGIDAEAFFATTTEKRGYFSWEASGPAFHSGAYWAIPTRAVTAAVVNGFAIYRIDASGRIAAEWVLLLPVGMTGDWPRVGADASAIAALVDDCHGLLRAGNAAAYRACWTTDAESRVSAGEADGMWTEAQVGIEAVEAGLEGSPYRGAERTGDIVRSSVNYVAYPFRGTADTCRAGIDVLALNADATAIRGHWAFCGP